MRKNCIITLVGIVALLTSSPVLAAPWPMQGHDARNSNFSANERGITRHDLPRLHATWTINGTSHAVVAGGKLFSSFTAGGGLGVFDARSGSQLRRFTYRQLGIVAPDSMTTLAYGSGRLIVATSLQIIALDTTGGRIWWRHPGGATELVVAGGVIYTGQGCQSFCGIPTSIALNLQTGRVLWRHPGNFGNRPVLVGGRLYQTWGEIAGTTRVYNPTTGRLTRTLPLSGQWTGSRENAYVAHAVAFGPAAPQWLTCTRADGRATWRLSLGTGHSFADSALAYGRLYLPSNRFHPGILAVDAANGHVIWGAAMNEVSVVNLPTITSPIVANRLVFVAAGPYVDVFAADTGELLRRVPLRPVDIEQLLLSNGTVYAVGAASVTAVTL